MSGDQRNLNPRVSETVAPRGDLASCKLVLDPLAFDPASVDRETSAVNSGIVASLSALPDKWSVPPAVMRVNRAKGTGPFAIGPESPLARTISIEGLRGLIPLRIVAPRMPNGVYLHFHGGGWITGAPVEHDQRHQYLADHLSLACVSVDYRLAPEEPYPAAPDDCEASALWLFNNSKKVFGTERLLIGGESAGAHLSVATLLRLRDRHGIQPFSAANLVSGYFDLSMTPSARRWGDEKLILTTRDLFMFRQNFLRLTGDVRDPDVSPLYADLHGLPPALFTVGTRDPLLDDSLFMAARWTAAGNSAQLEVGPGGCHVYTRLNNSMARRSLARIDAFLASACSGALA